MPLNKSFLIMVHYVCYNGVRVGIRVVETRTYAEHFGKIINQNDKTHWAVMVNEENALVFHWRKRIVLDG